MRSACPRALHIRSKRKFFLLVLYISIVLFLFFSDFRNLFTLDSLRTHYRKIRAYADENPIKATGLYMGSFIFCTAFAIPSALVFTIVAGLLFPQPLATLWASSGVTMGTMVLYVFCVGVLKEFLREKAMRYLSSAREQFNESAIAFLLFIRIVPGFPMFVTNLLPSVFDVHPWTYCWTTFVGILPAQYVFSKAGGGLHKALMSNEPIMSAIFNSETNFALLLLVVLSLIPLAIKRYFPQWIPKSRSRSQDEMFPV
eukprot:TRINITY_DN206_c0_g1_i1.p1 TRINITY_DN206_c0_g1~~TRINITY_DN206_c0_g1_i1.p1  ORF type:complete len:256 (+),score=38.29 TRINITY_DN206_c0_g1_i1:256-1023(+)